MADLQKILIGGNIAEIHSKIKALIRDGHVFQDDEVFLILVNMQSYIYDNLIIDVIKKANHPLPKSIRQAYRRFKLPGSSITICLSIAKLGTEFDLDDASDLMLNYLVYKDSALSMFQLFDTATRKIQLIDYCVKTRKISEGVTSLIDNEVFLHYSQRPDIVYIISYIPDKELLRICREFGKFVIKEQYDVFMIYINNWKQYKTICQTDLSQSAQIIIEMTIGAHHRDEKSPPIAHSSSPSRTDDPPPYDSSA